MRALARQADQGFSDASEYSDEITCVDDSSTNGSHDVLMGLDEVTLMTSDENHGSGASPRVGTQAVRGTLKP